MKGGPSPLGPPWPASARALEEEQRRLAALAIGADPWRPAAVVRVAVGGVFVALTTGEPHRKAAAGDAAWAAAVVMQGRRVLARAGLKGSTGAPYRPGYLALQHGALLEQVVRLLARLPDLLLVNATGRDHPRGAGLALHLGARLGVPTVGVTDRPLVASGEAPGSKRGSTAPLLLDDEVVGYWLRTRERAHPVAVHGAWRTDPETACRVVMYATRGVRTPEPLRRARAMARARRTRDQRRVGPGLRS